MDTKFLKEKFYLGGYYIVEPLKRTKDLSKSIFPETILSASDCVCEFFPRLIDSKEENEKYRNELMLDEKTYSEMLCWMKERMGKDFGYPNVFNSYESACEFCKKFLYNKDNLTILGFAIPKGEWKDTFLEEDNEICYGICGNVSKEIYIDERGKVLGYEILGYDFQAFHSYICNSLENDYDEKFGFKLNENGFISTFEEAEKLADYTNVELDGAEPVFWCPWIILQYPIE